MKVTKFTHSAQFCTGSFIACNGIYLKIDRQIKTNEYFNEHLFRKEVRVEGSNTTSITRG